MIVVAKEEEAKESRKGGAEEPPCAGLGRQAPEPLWCRPLELTQ